MNTLLIYPDFPDTFWSFKRALSFVGKRASLPPLGLLTVAAMLPKKWKKRLVDVNVRALTDRQLAWADCVFISAMIVQRKAARRIIARCKAAGVRVVAGGPLFNAEPDAFPEVDHLILNEAEATLPPFLEDMARGSTQRLYTSEQFPEMAATPVPQWSILEMKRYASMSLQYSRGCPFNCDFCNVTSLFGHRVRVKSTQQVIAELDSLYAAGWRGDVFFVDDNFIGNRRILKEELLPAINVWRRGKRGFVFNTEVSLNVADDAELLSKMVKTGFQTVFIGIETPDEACLTECGKGQNRNRDLLADVRRIQQAGLQVQGGFIVGFDHDRPSIFERQIDFIQQSGIVTAMVGLLQAPPGTPLYAKLIGEGRIRQEVSGDNVDGSTNIEPRMPIETLRSGYLYILKTIYDPTNYYQRIRTFMREYPTPAIRSPFKWSQINTLFRALVRLGIVGRERDAFWKLYFWTLFRRPRLLPEALTLAIYGFHFRKVCEQRLRISP